MDISSSSSDATFETRSFTGRAPGRAPGRVPGIRSDHGSITGTKNKQRDQRQTTEQPRESMGSSSGFQFDMLAWYPKYQSCQRYFVDVAQHDVLVQAFSAFINILLPYQRTPAVYTCRGARTAAERMEEITAAREGSATAEIPTVPVSLLPYLRRLVATGMDVPSILHGFFGNDWSQGVGPQRETERRNYLFAAKSGGWASVKRDYDMLPLETVPFLKPLMHPHDEELAQAEKSWSEWLAMEDWMVGSRAPQDDNTRMR